MVIQKRTARGIEALPLESELAASRLLTLNGEINMESAEEFKKQIINLNQVSDTEPITLLINSGGGEVTQGLMMYDIIQESKAPVRLVCTGEAYSMAAVLFASGRHGRYILSHSKVMLHEPLIPGNVGGKCSSIRELSDSLMAVRQMLDELLARHTGHSLEEIEKACEYDHYFTAQEAVDFGLCDKIISFREIF